MSQPYGQQPGDFNQGQGYNAMPPAPAEYSSGPIARPGTVTTAAVLAFVQAGLTLICSIILMIGLGALAGAMDDAETIGGIDVNEGALAGLWILAIVGLVGAGLLIWGGVKALSGTAGKILIIAAGLQILLCIIWLAAFQGGIVSILLVVMPIITLVMSLGGPAKQYEASRSGRA
jgi:hypothetical protein